MAGPQHRNCILDTNKILLYIPNYIDYLCFDSRTDYFCILERLTMSMCTVQHLPRGEGFQFVLSFSNLHAACGSHALAWGVREHATNCYPEKFLGEWCVLELILMKFCLHKFKKNITSYDKILINCSHVLAMGSSNLC